ncbi:MAG: alkaline phosphatase, partial [Saprospiraceae bacterium]|nr:alkaline phosphatase [Saprospiraceae bacterium]
MIGDGMGLTQMSAFMYANGNKAIVEKFPIVGFQKTQSANNLVTDSAGAATAMACGEKTHNSAIGVDIDTMPCKTILETFEERGLATGLVATASIVHATPAAFIAHVDLRNFYESIAEDFLETEIDYFVGGGEKYFSDRKNDKKDLIRTLKDKGYYVTEYSPTSRDFDREKIAWFTAQAEPTAFGAGRTYLPGATYFGMKFLDMKSENGFFMMVEGSQIDWACHYNDQRMFLEEMTDFNRAVAKALDFASKDKETLVIVTGDHECGGMAINEGTMFGKVNLEFTTNGHTGTMVPVYAYGPGAELFSGIYENTAIH